MKRLSITQVIWLPNPASVKFLNDPEQSSSELYSRFSLCEPDLDMATEGWVRVGTALVTCDVDNGSDTSQSAIAAVDLAIAKLQNEGERKLMALRQVKNDLLMLGN